MKITVSNNSIFRPTGWKNRNVREKENVKCVIPIIRPSSQQKTKYTISDIIAAARLEIELMMVHMLNDGKSSSPKQDTALPQVPSNLSYPGQPKSTWSFPLNLLHTITGYFVHDFQFSPLNSLSKVLI